MQREKLKRENPNPSVTIVPSSIKMRRLRAFVAQRDPAFEAKRGRNTKTCQSNAEFSAALSFLTNIRCSELEETCSEDPSETD